MLPTICGTSGCGWRTKNIVGSLYGGSLFAITDGAHPMMLMAALGEDYIVWDKSASIRYRKPGYTTLYADFTLFDEELASIRRTLEAQPDLGIAAEVGLHQLVDFRGALGLEE